MTAAAASPRRRPAEGERRSPDATRRRAIALARELAYRQQCAIAVASARLAARGAADLLDLARRSWQLVGRSDRQDAVRFDALCMHDAAVEELLGRGFGRSLVPARWKGNRA
jgi:hypothetical protein